jgi:hypothetical protein
MGRPLLVDILREYDGRWRLSVLRIIDAPDVERGFVVRTVARFQRGSIREVVEAWRKWRRLDIGVGTCATCQQSYALTNCGAMRFHKRWGRPCAGNGKSPAVNL